MALAQNPFPGEHPTASALKPFCMSTAVARVAKALPQKATRQAIWAIWRAGSNGYRVPKKPYWILLVKGQIDQDQWSQGFVFDP